MVLLLILPRQPPLPVPLCQAGASHTSIRALEPRSRASYHHSHVSCNGNAAFKKYARECLGRVLPGGVEDVVGGRDAAKSGAWNCQGMLPRS